VGCTMRATKPENFEGIESGAVAGTLTVNGSVTQLRYAYARRRQGRALDATRLGLHDDQAPQEVDYVLLTNLPLPDQKIDAIVDDEYKGAKNLNGILLGIDPTGANHWESQFLTDTQLFSVFGITSSGGIKPEVKDGRIFAMLALSNQDAIAQRAFLVDFDTALGPAKNSAASTDKPAAGCGIPDFARTLPGKWVIEKWTDNAKSATGTVTESHKGTLVVDERMSADQFHGTLLISTADDRPPIEEQATLNCTDGKIVLRGTVIPETHWVPDILTLLLENKRLSGTGEDKKGQRQTVALKKT
jgi:hypothetical protein